MKYLKLVILLFVSALVYQGCEKEAMLDTESGTSINGSKKDRDISISSGEDLSYNYSSYVSSNRRMLVFNNEEALQHVVESLASRVSRLEDDDLRNGKEDNDFDAQETVFNGFANQMKFRSLYRSMFDQENIMLSRLGFKGSIAQGLNKIQDLGLSDVMSAVVSHEGLMQVGRQIFYYSDTGIIYSIENSRNFNQIKAYIDANGMASALVKYPKNIAVKNVSQGPNFVGECGADFTTAESELTVSFVWQYAQEALATPNQYEDYTLQWQFGDNTTVTQTPGDGSDFGRITHTYDEAGTYNMTLYVTAPGTAINPPCITSQPLEIEVDEDTPPVGSGEYAAVACGALQVLGGGFPGLVANVNTVTGDATMSNLSPNVVAQLTPAVINTISGSDNPLNFSWRLNGVEYSGYTVTVPTPCNGTYEGDLIFTCDGVVRTIRFKFNITHHSPNLITDFNTSWDDREFTSTDNKKLKVSARLKTRNDDGGFFEGSNRLVVKMKGYNWRNGRWRKTSRTFDIDLTGSVVMSFNGCDDGPETDVDAASDKRFTMKGKCVKKVFQEPWDGWDGIFLEPADNIKWYAGGTLSGAQIGNAFDSAFGY